MAIMKPKIVPHLWFDTQAKEAASFYCSVFPDSEITGINTLKDTPSGDCDVVSFALMGQPFQAISAGPYFKFNEAVSFNIYCDTQQEIDSYWEQLSAVPAAEQCGWLKDKFGLSWQIVPGVMEELMQQDDADAVTRVTQALLKMKKLSIKDLLAAAGV